MNPSLTHQLPDFTETVAELVFDVCEEITAVVSNEEVATQKLSVRGAQRTGGPAERAVKVLMKEQQQR